MAAERESQRVRAWIKAHNRQAKREGGVRIVACPLPVKALWLNPAGVIFSASRAVRDLA
jgi:hypothetical protein